MVGDHIELFIVNLRYFNERQCPVILILLAMSVCDYECQCANKYLCRKHIVEHPCHKYCAVDLAPDTNYAICHLP